MKLALPTTRIKSILNSLLEFTVGAQVSMSDDLKLK